MKKDEWLDLHPLVMTLQQFEANAMVAESLDFDGFYDSQCTDLFRFYCLSVLHLRDQPAGVRGACDFFVNYHVDPCLRANFIQIENTPDFVPLPGDVAFWSATPKNSYGHVAIEIGPADVKEHTVLEQNYIKNKIGIRSDNYNSYLGVLRPKHLTEGLA